MKKYFFLALFIPLAVSAQVKKTTRTIKTKAKTAVTGIAETFGAGFVINVTTNFPDGTSFQMLNGSTGTSEQTTLVKNGKFSFKGNVASPDFKLIGQDGKPPFVTMFIENSNVTVNLKKDAIENAEIKGSAANNDFVAFNNSTVKYQDLFAGKGRYDVAFINEAGETIEKFVASHKTAFISPLAIIDRKSVV